MSCVGLAHHLRRAEVVDTTVHSACAVVKPFCKGSAPQDLQDHICRHSLTTKSSFNVHLAADPVSERCMSWFEVSAKLMSTLHCAGARVLSFCCCGTQNFSFELHRESLVLYRTKISSGKVSYDPTKLQQPIEGLRYRSHVFPSVSDRFKTTETVEPTIHGQRKIVSLGCLRRSG